MMTSVQRQIFETLQENYLANGIPCELIEASPEMPLVTLVTLFDEVGQSARDFRLEHNFYPPADGREHLHILQSMLALIDKVIPYHQPELLRFLAQVNYTLAIGMFGFLESRRMVYFKHNCMMIANDPIDQIIQQIDEQNGLIFQQLQIYYDAIEAVATGKKTAEESLSFVSRVHSNS